MNHKSKLVTAGVLAASCALVGSGTAHEGRVFSASTGGVKLFVGFHAEPAFEDTYNGVDVYAYTYDGPCPNDPEDFKGEPIDVSKGDEVNLSVDAIYLRDQIKPGGPVGGTPPSGILKSLKITADYPLEQAWDDPSLYNSYFRPTHPGDAKTGGAYGFHVYGVLRAKATTTKSCGANTESPIAARHARIDAYFVCGKGTLDSAEDFSCVRASQPFPGSPDDSYKPNRAFGGWGGS